MRMKALLLIVLLLFPAVISRGKQNTQPVFIRRYESGYSLHNLEDDAAYLADSAGPGGIVAVRICSNEAMPVALTIAAASPFVMSTILEVVYDFTPERILYLRSENCSSIASEIAPTEFWAIPQGAALPAFVESIRSNQVRLESIGAEAASVVGSTRNYRAAAQEFITKLRARSGAVGIVLGYYYSRPTSVMQQRLREIRILLEQSGLPPDRYIIRLARWTGERAIDPPEPEPSYPSVFVIEVTRDCARR